MEALATDVPAEFEQPSPLVNVTLAVGESASRSWAPPTSKQVCRSHISNSGSAVAQLTNEDMIELIAISFDIDPLTIDL